jgi:Domain of unknown function (DUF4333)
MRLDGRFPASMSIRVPIALALLLSAVAVAASACGSSKNDQTSTTKPSSSVTSVNTSTVESGIKQQFSSSGATVTSVKCPSDVKSKSGATFDCDVTWSNSATGKVKVTETSLGHFSYSLVSGSVQIPGSSVDKTLEENLAKQGAPNATVNCPQNIIVKVGTTVTCDVSGGGGKVGGTVTYTFSSAEGTIDPSSVKSG